MTIVLRHYHVRCYYEGFLDFYIFFNHFLTFSKKKAYKVIIYTYMLVGPSDFTVAFSFLATIVKRKRKVITTSIPSAQCPLLQCTLLQFLEQFAASWPKVGKNVLKTCRMTRMTVTPSWSISTKASLATTPYMMDPSDHGKVLQLPTGVTNIHGTKGSASYTES